MAKEEISNRKETTEQLPCKLTDKELMEISRQLATAHQKQQEIADRKKSFDAQCNADTKRLAAEIEQNSLKISTGNEFRSIACVWEYDWDNRKKKLIRLDKEEVVRVVDIEAHELQADMF
jgi:hypothetical protein